MAMPNVPGLWRLYSLPGTILGVPQGAPAKMLEDRGW
jgi:hypothetical protein